MQPPDRECVRRISSLRRLQSRQNGLDQVERADRPGADKGFAGSKVGGGAGQHGGAADTVENVGLPGRELRLIAADGSQLLLQRLADIDREVARVAAEDFGLESKAEINLRLNGVHRQVVE